MRTPASLFPLLAFGALLGVGCAKAPGPCADDGATEPVESPGCRASSGGTTDHFPLADGAQWTYRHMDSTGVAWVESITMSATQHAGRDAFVVVDTPDSRGVHDESVLLRDGSATLRVHREEYTDGALSLTVDYVPGFPRFDEAWLGASGAVVETYERTEAAPGGTQKIATRKQEYTVLERDVCVSVAAGEFNTVHVSRVRQDTLEKTLYWFADGIGKVLERKPATGASEQLESACLPGR